ncbi:MAG: hypothetical protein JOZ78_17320 [Chroococcidiopsidaceae cyanobacterium CP_BM_ER_R8_30]|nr:hypothetical protein [Chroococcidiopsidaceae cyanobacterium CP_BM_ER_R8_30]
MRTTYTDLTVQYALPNSSGTAIAAVADRPVHTDEGLTFPPRNTWFRISLGGHASLKHVCSGVT